MRLLVADSECTCQCLTKFRKKSKEGLRYLLHPSVQ